MRKKLATAVVAGLCVLASSSIAEATSVNLAWIAGASAGGITGLGTDSVTVSDTAVATLTLDIRIDIDSRGMTGGFSLEFDQDLGNELDVLCDGPTSGQECLVSIQELSWSDGSASLRQLNPGIDSTQESVTGTAEGQLYTFEGTSKGVAPSNTTLTFARVVFRTNPGLVSTDGDDVFSGAFNEGVDAVLANHPSGQQNVTSSVSFGNASVNPIPEPATLALLGLGATALALAARRGRR